MIILQKIVTIIMWICIFIIVILGVSSADTLVDYILKIVNISKEEARARFADFVNKPVNFVETSDDVFCAIRNIVRNVIGEKRFKDLVELEKNMNVRFLGYGIPRNELPYIYLSVNCENDDEKILIENILVNYFRRQLLSRGYNPYVICTWLNNYEMKISTLKIQYAVTNMDNLRIEAYKKIQAKDIWDKNEDIIDDTEEEDLT